MRRATLVLVAALLPLTGCTANRPIGGSAEEPPAEEPAADRRVVRAVPSAPSTWPRLRSALPRRVPTDWSALPALLDDPPGRASAVYHPPERWPEPVDGWASETLLFYGVDGTWRRLRMDELGLADEGWGSYDTYGAGSLSPDGRRWAGTSRLGVIVLDLATGEAQTIGLGSDWTASVEWRPDSRSLLVSHGSWPPRFERLELPSGRRTLLPFRSWQAGFAPDGTAFSVRTAGPGPADLVTWKRGVPVPRGELDLPRLARSPYAGGLIGPGMTDGRFLVVVQRPPYRTFDLVVVGTTSLEVEARLHVPRRIRFNFTGFRWLDPRTVLLGIGPGLIAWRPAEGALYRVTDLPDPGRDAYATLAVALDLVKAGPAGTGRSS
ncbi:hypothetical protein GCM10027062_08290 [Nocardioides hungaricus]